MERKSESYNPKGFPEVRISLNSIDAVKEFVNTIMQFDFNADIASLSTQHIIDAKSIMGIFSLDLSKNVALVAYTNPNEAGELFGKIGKFIVNA